MEDIMLLLEGTCPACGNDADIIFVSGLEDEVVQFADGLPDDAVTIWTERPPYSKTVLEVELSCKHHHTYVVAKNEYGDWN